MSFYPFPQYDSDSGAGRSSSKIAHVTGCQKKSENQAQPAKSLERRVQRLCRRDKLHTGAIGKGLQASIPIHITCYVIIWSVMTVDNQIPGYVYSVAQHLYTFSLLVYVRYRQ